MIFDSTKILLPKRLVLTYNLIAKVMHCQILFTDLKWSYILVFKLYPVLLGSYFPS